MSGEQNQLSGSTQDPFYDNPKEDGIQVGDPYELLTKFAMEPNLGKFGYGEELRHINKNLSLTNLKEEYGDISTIKNQGDSLTILGRHWEEKITYVPTGEYRDVEREMVNGEAVVIRVPVYAEKHERTLRFKITMDSCANTMFITSATAGGRDASLLKVLKTAFINKDQSIEDRTETRPGFWAKMKKH